MTDLERLELALHRSKEQLTRLTLDAPTHRLLDILLAEVARQNQIVFDQNKPRKTE